MRGGVGGRDQTGLYRGFPAEQGKNREFPGNGAVSGLEAANYPGSVNNLVGNSLLRGAGNFLARCREMSRPNRESRRRNSAGAIETGKPLVGVFQRVVGILIHRAQKRRGAAITLEQGLRSKLNAVLAVDPL